MNQYYKDYSEYLAEKFPGLKVQKISVNAGFSCPNRDGTIGRGGCIYCDNSSFTPAYCFNAKGVRGQIEAGKRFFGRKYPEMKYLAYFQSFTNTFGPVEEIESLYREALDCPDIVGMIVGTRPDCLPDGTVALLASLNCEKPVLMELGAETFCDDTLRLINRGHTSAQTMDAVNRLSAAGLPVGLHLIAGLPGESDDQVLENVNYACSMRIDSIKLHHLQVIRDSELHCMWKQGEIEVIPYDLQRYLDLCVNIVEMVPRHIAIERFLASSPQDKVVAPHWGLKNYQFVNLLHKRLESDAL